MLMAKNSKSKLVVWNWYGLDVYDKDQIIPGCKLSMKVELVKDGSTTDLYQQLKHHNTPELHCGLHRKTTCWLKRHHQFRSKWNF